MSLSVNATMPVNIKWLYGQRSLGAFFPEMMLAVLVFLVFIFFNRTTDFFSSITVFAVVTIVVLWLIYILLHSKKSYLYKMAITPDSITLFNRANTTIKKIPFQYIQKIVVTKHYLKQEYTIVYSNTPKTTHCDCCADDSSDMVTITCGRLNLNSDIPFVFTREDVQILLPQNLL